MAQYKGTVKWFNNVKGYGFLGYDGGNDVFVHFSSIQKEGYKFLKEGDEVTFDIVQGKKVRLADRVTRETHSHMMATPASGEATSSRGFFTAGSRRVHIDGIPHQPQPAIRSMHIGAKPVLPSITRPMGLDRLILPMDYLCR